MERLGFRLVCCIRTYLSFLRTLYGPQELLGVAIGGGAFLRKFQNGEAHTNTHTHTYVCVHNAEVGCGKIRSQFRIATRHGGEENYVTLLDLG